MPGETNLHTLIQSMNPELNPGEYVFCTVSPDKFSQITVSDIFSFFREHEGITLILSKEAAEKYNLPYSFVAAWITLTVHSALEAVGLTAAFSNALADHGISCNVVAGYYHDHIFVDRKDAKNAIIALKKLSGTL